MVVMIEPISLDIETSVTLFNNTTLNCALPSRSSTTGIKNLNHLYGVFFFHRESQL